MNVKGLFLNVLETLQNRRKVKSHESEKFNMR